MENTEKDVIRKLYKKKVSTDKEKIEDPNRQD